MKSNEKFFAFVLLGAALVGMAVMVYLHPLNDTTANSGSIQIINTITGALTLAFGGAANALFRVREQGEPPIPVTAPPGQPLPVDPVKDASEPV